MVKVVLGRTLLGSSATVNTALVLLPLTVIPTCCIPDVEDTLISQRSISNSSKFGGCIQRAVIVTLHPPETLSTWFTVTFSGAAGTSVIRKLMVSPYAYCYHLSMTILVQMQVSAYIQACYLPYTQ